MATTKGTGLAKLTKNRLDRLVNEVAPLVAQGLTQRQIAAALGISNCQVSHDVKAVRELWADNYSNEQLEAVRGEAVARTDLVYGQAIQQWFEGKKAGTPNPKLLDTALHAIKEKGRLCGADIDVKLIHQSVNFSMASAEEVNAMFSPMSAADFAAFSQAHQDNQIKAAAAAQALAAETHETHAEAVEADAAGVDDSWVDATTGDQQLEKPKSKRIRHPRG